MTSLTLDELPLELFDYIMFLIGSGSLRTLDTCRKVSRSWNNRIMRSLWEEPNKQWGAIVGRWVKRRLFLNPLAQKTSSKAVKLEADGILPASVIVTFAEKLRVTCEYPGLPEIRCAAI